MNWLNINLATLRSKAYMASTPVQQATWLKLLAYCADQENGGRIAGAAAWSERQWLVVCGVTAREVRGAGQLVIIDGDDIVVPFYPVEKEAEVRVRRIAATEAANRRWHGKLRPGAHAGDGEEFPDPAHAMQPAAPVPTTALLPLDDAMGITAPRRETQPPGLKNDASRIARGIAPSHAEEKENEKGREMEEKGTYASLPDGAPPVREALSVDPGESRGRLCSMRSAILHGMRLEPPCPEQWAAKWWEDCEKRGWVDNHGIPLQQWQPALSSYWRGVQEQDRRSGALGTLTPGSAGKGTTAGSASEINARLKGIDEERFRLRLKAADGRSPDGLRTIKIYTPDQETRRDQLLAAKETLKRKLTEVG